MSSDSRSDRSARRASCPTVHFGYFQSQFFVSLDTWSLLPGERPGVHDFRASDIYFACRDLSWELVAKKPS